MALQTLSKLQTLLAAFETRLESSPQPIRQIFDMPLSHITILCHHSQPMDSYNAYLTFRQIEHAITQIQALVEEKNIQAIAVSTEFKELNTSQSFLIEQQRELYPHYFAAELQHILDIHNKVDSHSLREKITVILANNQQNGEEKTQALQYVIEGFTGLASQRLGLGLLFEFDGYKKVLKTALQDKLDALTPEIKRLYNPPEQINKVENQQIK